MQYLRNLPQAYRGKRVLVTGHTGFKGSWLCEWLLLMGAKVTGVALPPDTTPSLFNQLHLEGRLDHHILDIRDREALRTLVLESRPDMVFHLAAQPLVRRSYREPVETYETNVMGTVHLLDALRHLGETYKQEGDRHCAVVVVTSDKCYANREWLYGYREEDPMGGHDPYSSSKGCAELVAASYRSSFFNPKENPTPLHIGIATARAGNVIGGGDWAEDRIVPDSIRHLEQEEAIPIRRPWATRPWQHVLEPLGGYLLLAEQMYQALSEKDGQRLPVLCSAFNFGPGIESNRAVQSLVEEILKHWHGTWEDQSTPRAPHEASLLSLSTEKAYHILGWRPAWGFEKTVQQTVCGYREAQRNNSTNWVKEQIDSYARDAEEP